MFLFENNNGNATIIYNPVGIPNSELEKSLFVESLPTEEVIPGKRAILKVKVSEGKVWWEYEDIVVAKKYLPVLTKAEFKRRLTFEERARIINYDKYIVAGIDPITGQLETNDVVMAKKEMMSVVIDDFKDFREIDLNDTAWVEDFTYILVYCRLLTADRIKEILSL